MTRFKKYRPEPYHKKMSIFWFLNRKPYLMFIIRELTSIFVAAYAVILLFQLNALSQGPEAWEALVATFSTPLSIALHIVIFVFVLFHTITWFMLAPSAMVMKVGKMRIPDFAIIAGNFLMWIVLSAGIVWMIL